MEGPKMSKLFTMKVSRKWLEQMRKLAKFRSEDEKRDISIAELVRDACRILYKIDP